MEIKLSYSKVQLDKTVEFISKHNKSFKKQNAYIRNVIVEYMHKIAIDPDSSFIGTMGFTLIADREFEDLDSDENLVRIEINVDPALGNDDIYLDDDNQEETINATARSIWAQEAASDETVK